MPVDFSRHDPDGPVDVRPGTNKARIIQLLYRDTNLGYTPAEIRQELDLPRGSTSTTLSRLREDGLVGKTSDGLYHGLDHREDLRRFAKSLVSLDSLFDRHPEAGMDLADVEQTGESAREEIPAERLQRDEGPTDEPEPAEWVGTEDESED